MEFKAKGTRVTVNVTTEEDLNSVMSARLSSREGFALATLNLDHLVKLKSSPEFCVAYGKQDFITADGNPIVWLSNIAQQPVDLLPGADLVIPLTCLAADAGRPVAFVGSTPESLEKAAQNLVSSVPNAQIVTKASPPMGFDPTGPLAREILEELEAKKVGMTFIALGAPKQEMFAAYGREIAPSVGFASIGAGLDFLSGQQLRAPVWVRRLALEWLWRVMNNPKRMLRRYFLCALILPEQIVNSFKMRRSPDQPAE